MSCHVARSHTYIILVYHISLGRMDGPELIRATPHGLVLPKIQIERILIGNADRLFRGVRSCAR